MIDIRTFYVRRIPPPRRRYTPDSVNCIGIIAYRILRWKCKIVKNTRISAQDHSFVYVCKLGGLLEIPEAALRL